MGGGYQARYLVSEYLSGTRPIHVLTLSEKLVKCGGNVILQNSKR